VVTQEDEQLRPFYALQYRLLFGRRFDGWMPTRWMYGLLPRLLYDTFPASKPRLRRSRQNYFLTGTLGALPWAALS
jgi:hypothetical protein